MKTFKTIPFALVMALGASAAVGCAGSDDDVVDDDDDDDDQDDDVDPNTTPVGKYSVQSEFDMATGVPGDVGQVVNTIIEATDGPDDPGRWICDTAAAQIGSDTLRDIAEAACAVAGGYINDRLLEIAPDFVTTIVQLGSDLGHIARNFGIESQLEITAAGTGFVSKHTVRAMSYKLPGSSAAELFPLEDYDMPPVVVSNVGLVWETTGKITVQQHTIPLSYAAVLRVALDEVIIPGRDPTATHLPELLQNLVDCNAVAYAIYDAIGFGSIGTFESACESGLVAGANLAYSQLGELGELKFNVTGTARGTDRNGDKKVDEIKSGTWAGMIDYSGTLAPLSNSTFVGSRM